VIETPPDQLVEEGFVAFRQGRDGDAQRLFERSAEFARERSDRQVLMQALGGLARVALRAGETQRTRELALEALELADDEAAQWSPRHMLAAAARAEGDYDRAQALYDETLALARRLDLRIAEAAELLNLGYVALHLGQTERAVERFRKSLEIGAELKDDYLLPYCLLGAGSSALLRGDAAEGATRLAAAKAAFDATGAAIDPGSAEEYEAAVADARRRLGDAFDAVWAEGSRLSLSQAVERALG
jgi:tetratricopeptide (TPR) repeat protein